MPVAVHYDVDGVAEVEHMLMGMAARAIETRPLLEGFQDDLQKQMAARFAAQGEGDWPPLAPATVAKKGSSVIGRETDAMMGALTEDGAEGALREIIGDELIFGINLTNDEGFPYPVVFNDGAEGQEARPLFNTDTLDLRRFTKVVHAWLMAGERAEFGVGDFGLAQMAFPMGGL